MMFTFCKTDIYSTPQIIIDDLSQKGIILLINGATCTGKTSLANEFILFLNKAVKNSGILAKDYFLLPRSERAGLIPLFASGKGDISKYSGLSWNLKSFHNSVKKVHRKLSENPGQNELMKLQKVYNRVTGKQDQDAEVCINKNGLIIIEGTQSLDAFTGEFAAVTIYLKVKNQEILLDRLLNRELLKPAALRLNPEYLQKRFRVIDIPHAAHLENLPPQSSYTYVIDTSNLPEVVIYKNN